MNANTPDPIPAGLLQTAARDLAVKRTRLAGLCLAVIPWLHTPDATLAAALLPDWHARHLRAALRALPQDDAVFCLFEDLALLVRAHSLRPSVVTTSTPLVALLDAFESSGEWHPEDGTLVSEWYWLRLPAMRLARRCGEDPACFAGSHAPRPRCDTLGQADTTAPGGNRTGE